MSGENWGEDFFDQLNKRDAKYLIYNKLNNLYWTGDISRGFVEQEHAHIFTKAGVLESLGYLTMSLLNKEDILIEELEINVKRIIPCKEFLGKT